MNRTCSRPGALVCLLFVIGASQLPARTPYPFHFSFKSGDAFAFIGDGTTYDGFYGQYIENFFLTRYPDKRVLFYHAGCKHDTAEDILERLDEDVIPRNIDYAFLLCGTWDGHFESFSEFHYLTYQAHYSEILDRLKEAKIHPFLISPPMFDQQVREQRVHDETFGFRMHSVASDYNGVMALFGSWVREEASRRGMRFID
ncbi:MAG: hypothetical protein AAF191_18490, partial [Verrucomicrobiota bacterium]